MRSVSDMYTSMIGKQIQEPKNDHELACMQFKSFCNRIKVRSYSHSLDDLYEELTRKGFLTCPASASHHGNIAGGLIIHSEAVVANLRFMTHRLNLEWQDSNSPEVIGFLHDVCKLDSYSFDAEGKYKYRAIEDCDLPFGGHGMKSLIMLQRYIELTDEEMFCIRFHMGAYEKEAWNEFDAAIKRYPNVLWVHTADMAASKIDQK